MPEETLMEAMNQPPSLTFEQKKDHIETISQLSTEISAFAEKIHVGVAERPNMLSNGQKIIKSETFPIGNKGSLSVNVSVSYKEKKK